MHTSSFLLAAGLLLSTTGCGARTLPVTGGEGGVASTNPEDASTDGGSDADAEAEAEADQGGPPPVPVCTGNSQCLPPGDAGLSYSGSGWSAGAVIQCQPESYAGPWTLLLERLSGTTYQPVAKQVVQEPGFGATFYDKGGPSTQRTYRVCVIEKDGTAMCGSSFVTAPPPNCPCEPTSCYLQEACNTTIDDQCGGTLHCGACSNGASCNSESGSCCATGFVGDGWGGCVCAQRYPCLAGDYWNTTDCICETL
jgi:hypothetical protein